LIWFELMNLFMFDNFFCVWTRFQVGWLPTGIFGWTSFFQFLHSYFLHFVAIGRQQRWLRRDVEQKRATNHRWCCCCEGKSTTFCFDGKTREWGRGKRELGLGEVARQPRRSGDSTRCQIRSQSFQALFFSNFPFSLFSLSVCNIWKYAFTVKWNSLDKKNGKFLN